jgi:hypothetical protein
LPDQSLVKLPISYATAAGAIRMAAAIRVQAWRIVVPAI